MVKALPEFAPLSLKELRSFWKKYRGNGDIERLVLEVQFGRGVINEIDVYFKTIHHAWRKKILVNQLRLRKCALCWSSSICGRPSSLQSSQLRRGLSRQSRPRRKLHLRIEVHADARLVRHSSAGDQCLHLCRITVAMYFDLCKGRLYHA
jgi:hypothetical protein